MPDIRLISNDDHNEWDRFVQSFSEGGAYLTIAWKKAVQRTYHHQTYYLAAFNKGNITGVLPLVHIKPPFKRGGLVSLPFCDFGGAFSQRTAELTGLLHKALEIAKHNHAGLEIRCPSPVSVLENDDRYVQKTSKCRMLLSLPQSSGALMSGFKSKLRSQIKKPLKEGLRSELGHAEKVDDFYAVISKNMRDLGSPVHSRRWFRNILSQFKERSLVCIVYWQNIPVAAAIILMHGSSVTIPWASSLREYNRYSPNMLLYWTVLAYASDNGFKLFDFGRSTPGEGTFLFKKQWGANPVPLHWYLFSSSQPAVKTPEDRENFRDVAEKVWQRMPLFAANTIGPVIRKYIDR